MAGNIEYRKDHTTLWNRFVRFPLTRIVIGLIMVGLVGIGGQSVLTILGFRENPVLSFLAILPVVALAWGAYLAFIKIFEKRRLTEFELKGGFKEFLLGIGAGTGLITFTILMVWLMGFFKVIQSNPWILMLLPLADAVFAGFVEEIMFRGIIFRIVEESLGTWLALLISAVMFGLIHVGNPGATFYSTFAISAEAGVLLASAYVFTRRLWFPIGIHLAWNFTQGGIFGVKVSGKEVQGIIQSQLEGPMWLSGGIFGVETSIIAVIICVSGGIYFLVQAHKKGRIIEGLPFRAKKRKQTEI